MPNVAKVLREEVQRLSRKELKTALTPLRRDSIRLKKAIAGLRREVAALARSAAQLEKRVPVAGPPAPRDGARKLRPTADSLLRLRTRLGLTQLQFAKLLGVSGQAVVNWAAAEGRIRMRNSNLAALAAIQGIGKREARKRLAALDS
jgi:hypothetical protein